MGEVTASARRRPRTALLACLPTGAVGAEIGVWKGNFSAILLEELRPKRLHLIDPWRYQPSEAYASTWYGSRLAGGQAAMDAMHAAVLRRFHRAISREQVVVHRATSHEAADAVPDEYFDWVYIDGDHSYEQVRADLNRYSAKLRSGGLLCGDDYSTAGWWGDGVVRAVEERAAQWGCATQVLGRQFLLRKP